MLHIIKLYGYIYSAVKQSVKHIWEHYNAYMVNVNIVELICRLMQCYILKPKIMSM